MFSSMSMIVSKKKRHMLIESPIWKRWKFLVRSIIWSRFRFLFEQIILFFIQRKFIRSLIKKRSRVYFQIDFIGRVRIKINKTCQDLSDVKKENPLWFERDRRRSVSHSSSSTWSTMIHRGGYLTHFLSSFVMNQHDRMRCIPVVIVNRWIKTRRVETRWIIRFCSWEFSSSTSFAYATLDIWKFCFLFFVLTDRNSTHASLMLLFFRCQKKKKWRRVTERKRKTREPVATALASDDSFFKEKKSIHSHRPTCSRRFLSSVEEICRNGNFNEPTGTFTFNIDSDLSSGIFYWFIEYA